MVAARHNEWSSVVTIDLANGIFLIALLAGGLLLLLTVLLDDILGGLLDFLNVDFDLGGVSLMPLLFGFVAMFGVGGLFGTQVFGLDAGRASVIGGVSGAIGSGLVFAVFSFLRRAEAPEAFSLRDLVGQRARVNVGIPAHRYGSVLMTYAGTTQSLTATSDTDLPAGTIVTVTAVAGSTVIVEPRRRTEEGVARNA